MRGGCRECEAVIIVDLSNDPSYAEVLYETFVRRVIGLHTKPARGRHDL